MKNSTLRLTRGAVIAALYFALSAAVPVITYGPVQFRVAEALTLLPFFMPEAIWGVTLGCLLTNAFSSFGSSSFPVSGLSASSSVVCLV